MKSAADAEGPWKHISRGADVRTGARRRRLERSFARGAGALCALTVLALGCGSDGKRDPLGDTPLDHVGGPVDAGSEDVEPPAEADAGTGPAIGDAGEDASNSLPGPTCGDGQWGDDEACDGAQPSYRPCSLVGFDEGVLGCNADCTWNTQSCSGVERCTDGRDNDGDGSVDCDDVETCSGACADACSTPTVIEANSTVSGSTLGHSTTLSSSCGGTESGSEVAYQVTAADSGKLDVLLETDGALAVSLRSSCADSDSELECGLGTRLTLDAEAGATYFIVVDGSAAEDAGEFLISVALREPACGDGIRDSHEECDDGNINDGDGCDPDCFLESSETESNDSLGSADLFDFGPWFAELSPEGDADYYRVPLTAASSTIVVDTLNFGDGACGLNLMDTVIDIFDTNANGNSLLVSDDDSGDGACARAVATGLPPGNYFVRVSAGAAAEPATFPYRLSIEVGECGDGDLTFGEQCDDQNLIAGDGCDQSCRSET